MSSLEVIEVAAPLDPLTLEVSRTFRRQLSVMTTNEDLSKSCVVSKSRVEILLQVRSHDEA